MKSSPEDQNAEKRRRAEELLRIRLHGPLENQTKQSLEELLHELAVHQIELEMQNEELRRTEFKLETARKKYSDLYNLAPVGYFSFDSKGKILEANLAGARMLGLERGSLVGKVFTEFCTKTSADQFFLHLRRVFKDKETQKCELTIDQGGIQFDMVIESIAVQDEDGNFSQCQSALIDITDRKRAEEALRQSEEQLRIATNAAEIGVWSWTPGTSNVVVSANWRYLFGIAPEAGVTFETWRDALHPEDRDRAVAELNAANEQRREFNTEYRVVRSDSTMRWIVDRGRAWYDEHDRPIGMAGVNIDITERKKVEEALLESERRYRSLFENMPDGSAYCQMVFDDQGLPEDFIYLQVNDAFGKLTGLENVVGKRVTEVIPGIRESQPELFEIYGRVSLSGQPERFEVMLKSLGQWLSVAVYSPRQGYFVAIFDNITQRKEDEEALNMANERLLEADRHKDEFLAMLAHELRNPLAPVRNAVAVLQYAGSSDSRLQRQSAIIDRQVTHMARLLDDLLDVSRITRGKIDLQKQPLHLTDVLAHAVETATPLVQARNQTLNVTDPPDELLVEGDLDRLVQVVGNLLTNALKYTKEGGEIWLEAKRDGDHAVIRVRDGGMGISSEMLPRVFDLFAQADRTLGRAQGGLGIGLTMVSRLVQMHGGTVEAHSAGLGYGSEFIVRLPVLPEIKELSAHPPKPEKPNRKHQPRRILVVDDVTDTAGSMAELLELWGHKVQAAHDGLSALEAVRQFRPEVVLLDIGMPGMDGFEVAQYLRKEHPDLPMLLVALTGYAQESDRREARQAGFDLHLSKPVDLEALRELLDQPVAGPS